jgi:iron complex outermembrane receptor protein
MTAGLSSKFANGLKCSTAALALLVMGNGVAFAQSTGTLTVESVVVTGQQESTNFGGYVSPQDAPKTRENVSQQYISEQPVGANALSDLNLIPGVNFTNDDPYGMSGSGGHFSIRGIKGANVGEMVDGVPLNDAGNYAIYPGELVDPEVISNVNVITGSSDVDSPLSSSLGGTVNINTLTPTDDMNGFVNTSAGSFNYWRVAGLFNTGEFGAFGTKAWIEASQQMNQKYTGIGNDKKWQVNAKIYQDLHHNGDFIAIAGFYDRQLADFYYGDDFASFATTGVNKNPAYTGPGYNYEGLLTTGLLGQAPWNQDYIKTYVQPSSATNNGSFQGVEENPTWTGNLRGASRFTILDNLHLTVDPSFQWVLANGQGSTNVSGTDPRLIGLGVKTNLSNYPACFSAAGVVTGLDLDGATTAAGAPICTDSTRLLSPSNTQTHRYTVNASLIWDITDTDLVQLSYAYDHAHVRQTGEYGQLQADGYPQSIFGGLQGYGTPIIAADGTTLQKRNRLTIAELNQGALEYIGRFFGDQLRLDVGVRDPFLSRNLNQYCFTQPASNVYCTPNASVAAAQSGGGYQVLPFQINTSYNKLLPNLGATWQFNDQNSIFADYASALNAPVNDDLYSIAVIGSGTTPAAVGKDNVKPETSQTWEAGYRYQTPMINATLDGYYLTDQNHIVQSFNQQTQDSIDQNVGSIDYYGFEGIAGAQLIDNLTLIQSFAYNHSEYKSNIPYSATVVIPTQGKVAADTPLWTVSQRLTYKWNNVDLGVQWKFVDKRFVTLVDDLAVPSYTTIDADIRVHLDDFAPAGAYVQFNVLNILNEQYIGSINVTNSNNSSLQYYSEPYGYQGAPRTFQLSLHIPMPF